MSDIQKPDDKPKEPVGTVLGGIGCLLVIAGFIAAVVFFFFSACTGGPPSYEPSKGMMSIMCERAIAPARAADYTVLPQGGNVFTVKGSTTAGAAYYCQYKWNGGESYSLLEVGVAGQ